jgi:hypothetical protein
MQIAMGYFQHTQERLLLPLELTAVASDSRNARFITGLNVERLTGSLFEKCCCFIGYV